MNSPEQYCTQLDAMAANAKAWRAANPDKKVLVQFNFPTTVAVIACISDAVKNHYVTANPEGLELLKALWPWGVRSEPTVLMVRAVLEHQPEDWKIPPH